MLIADKEVPEAEFEAFCRRWEVRELALFGSALGETFGPESDIDLLVTFAPDARWSVLDHMRMENELVDLLGREVDLVCREAIEESRNWIRRNAILSTARTIYAA